MNRLRLRICSRFSLFIFSICLFVLHKYSIPIQAARNTCWESRLCAFRRALGDDLFPKMQSNESLRRMIFYRSFFGSIGDHDLKEIGIFHYFSGISLPESLILSFEAEATPLLPENVMFNHNSPMTHDWKQIIAPRSRFVLSQFPRDLRSLVPLQEGRISSQASAYSVINSSYPAAHKGTLGNWELEFAPVLQIHPGD